MSTVLRLARAGGKKKPFFHVVAADVRAPRDGRFIEKIGYYDPKTSPSRIQLDAERLEHWISVGARRSETVERLIRRWKKQQAAAE